MKSIHQPLLRLMLLCFFMLSLVTTQATAQMPYGHGEDVYLTRSTIARAGDVLYIPWSAQPGKAQRFLVAVDIATPAQPREIGRIALDGFPQDVAVKNNRAYVTNGLSLITLDITDPSAMKIVHTLTLTDNPMQGPQAIDIDENDIAFLACRRGGVRAIDLQNPNEPRPVAQLKLPGFARDVLAGPDGRLYVAADTMGIHTAGIKRDDASPRSISLSLLSEHHHSLVTQGTPASLTRHGQTVYVAAGSLPVVTIKADRSRVEQTPDSLVNGTVARGSNQAYYGSYAHDLAVIELPDSTSKADVARTLIFIADGEAGITGIDITDPLDIQRLTPPDTSRQASSQTMLATAIHVLQRDGESPVVFILDQNHGLRVFTLDKHMQLQPQGDGLKFDKD